MEYNVEKTINLRLSQEEFNTIVIGFGSTSHEQREKASILENVEILNVWDSHELYENLERIMRSIKGIF